MVVIVVMVMVEVESVVRVVSIGEEVVMMMVG